MGMFDTFWGEYKCPACGNIVRFEEQTKDYYCVLEDFYLGDFIDRGNRNYFMSLNHIARSATQRMILVLQYVEASL